MSRVTPILHLAIPVRDLSASRRFYVDVLGCEVGRERERWIDVWFFGLQLTLHERPEEVTPLDRAGVRHFGVTLTEGELEALLARLANHEITWLAPVSTDYTGTPAQQTKSKIADPSSNVIELKAYANPDAAFETTRNESPLRP